MYCKKSIFNKFFIIQNTIKKSKKFDGIFDGIFMSLIPLLILIFKIIKKIIIFIDMKK